MIAHGRRGFVGQRGHLFVVTKYYEHPTMPAPARRAGRFASQSGLQRCCEHLRSKLSSWRVAACGGMGAVLPCLAPTRGVTLREPAPGDEIDEVLRDGSASSAAGLQFRRLLQKLPAGAYTCDAEGLITYYNQHAERLWGRAPKLNDPADRFCGSFKLFATDGTPITHDRCWMALALKTDREYNRREVVVERPDGRRLTALAHANPIHDESGELIGAVNVLVDITERKRAEEELRRAELFARSTLNSLSANIAILDESGAIVAINRAWHEFAAS